MADQEAFLQAIAEEPEDDSLRLIYADWLEERDDPRAEFIRLQCELAGMEETAPRHPNLRRREDELLRLHRSTWLEPLKSSLHQQVTFRRGLPEQVRLPTADFLVHAEVLSRLGPIRHVQLAQVRDYLSNLARCPLLNRIEYLNLSHNQLRPGDLESLTPLLRPSAEEMGQARLDRLVGLSLAGNPIGPEGVRALTRGLQPDQLRYLNLNDCGLRATGAEVLATWPGFAHLLELYLDENGLSAAGIDALSRRSGGVAQLRVLSLARNQIPPNGVRLLAQTPRLAALSNLCLAHNPLGNEGVETLACSGVLTGLTVLDLNSTRLSASGARALFTLNSLRDLQRLDLAHNQIGTLGAVALSRSPNLSRLTVLDLAGNEVGDEGAKALAASKHLTQLTTLNLSANGVKAFGLKELLVALSRLHTLDLKGNKLGNLAVEVLALSPRLKQIQYLNLRNNHVDDEGIRALATSKYLDGLRHLDLTDNDLSEDGVALLRNSALGNKTQVSLELDEPVGCLE